MAECSPVLHRRLAMRAHRGGGAGCRRRVAEHRLDVAGLLGVVGEAREVAAGLERGEDRRVQGTAPVRRDLACDGEARELVPEGDPVALGAKDTRGEAVVEPAELHRGDLLEQPELRSRRHHRDRSEQPARALVE